MRQDNKKYVVITIVADILFGLIPIYWKLFSPGVSTLYILMQRIFWSIPFTLAIVALQRNMPALKAAFHNKRVMLLTAAAGLVITVNWYVYIWAVQSGMVLETSLAYFMSPLVVFLFGLFVFKEKAEKTDLVAICICALGVIISSVMLGAPPWIALSLAVTFAVYGALKKAAGLGPAVSLTIEMIVVLPFALIGLAVTSFGSGGALAQATPLDIVLLIGTGFISSFPLWLYSYGVKELPFNLVGFLQFIWPSTSMLLSVFGFHEKLLPAKMVCFCFVWAAILLFTIAKAVRGRKNSRTA